MDDEDFFSADDLDDVPDGTLQALESHAFVSTQATRQDTTASKTGGPPAPLRRQPHNAASFNRPGTSSKIPPWRPPQRSQQPAAHTGPPASAPDLPSSDYGLDEEDVIDLDEPSMIVQPASGVANGDRTALRVQQLRNSNARRASKAEELDPETAAAFAAADAELGGYNAEQWLQAPHLAPKAAGGDVDITSLQARIADLEAERERLRQAEQDARNTALAKQGEIAIVRANQEKASREYERRIAVMQKLHQDEASKQKAEIEASRKEREKMETDNRFLQHDLAQEAERVKRLNGPGKVRGGPANVSASPHRAKRIKLGDGFADEEVTLVSPSKSKDRSRDQTPKVGTKRKRQAQDSPLAPLVFSQPANPQRENSAQSATTPDTRATPPAHIKVDDKFRFLQSILDYRPSLKQPRTLEALTKHHFPSDANKTLSAIFLDDLNSRVSEEPMSLQTARALLNLWSRCLAEKDYSPLALILDMIRFALHFELPSVSATLIELAAPLCARSIDLVDSPRARASLNTTFAATRNAQHDITSQIDVGEVLDFLYYLAQASTLSSERTEAFWRQMDLNFALLMLNKAHPIQEIIVGLQILGTSVLTTSFGVISDDSKRQAELERNTLDRLSSLLFNIPNIPSGEDAYTDEEIAELRVANLEIFRLLCLTDHGSFILAEHRSVIGRLLRFLDGQVRKLYTLPPSIGALPRSSSDGTEEVTAHDLVVKTINTTVRILYHLLRTFNETIDLSQKLNAVHGGYHKFLVSLTRIAFTEQLVFEHGIETEVVEAAHAILDNILSPEEGEAVVKAIETPRGTRSASKSTSRTSVDPADSEIIVLAAPE